MDNFTKDRCNVMGPQLIAALQQEAARLGLTVQHGASTFSAYEWNFTVKITLAGEAGMPAAKAHWDTHCAAYGLKPEHFGTTITIRGEEHKVVGLKLHDRYPIRTTRVRDGKIVQFLVAALVIPAVADEMSKDSPAAEGGAE